jgi:hypothetical protein
MMVCEASDGLFESLFEAAISHPIRQKISSLYTSPPVLPYTAVTTNSRLDQDVLLDDRILDFMAKVPIRCNRQNIYKVVIRNIRASPNSLYKRANLEDWQKLLATETPVRDYALAEFNDRSSGIWEFLDPLVLTKIIESVGKKLRFQSVVTQTIKPKSLIKQGLTILAPGLLARTQAQRHARPVINLGVEKIILRSLVLKNWYDTFVH